MPTRNPPLKWADMRNETTPLMEVVESFMAHRHDLSAATARNYRFALGGFAAWVEREFDRPSVVGDVEPGTVNEFLAFRRTSVSAQTARSAWVALRSLARFLAERGIHHANHETMLRPVRMPKVKDDARRALSDAEMWRLIDSADQGETGPRDRAIVWTLLGCGLRREELCGLRLAHVDLGERRIHVRAATSKSVHSRDVTIPVEVVKELDMYLADHRKGEVEPDAPAFSDRYGRPLTGVAVRKLFERLKVRTGINNDAGQ